MRKNNTVDMINGPLFKSIIIYALPLILLGIIQILFNAVNTAVVGKFSGSEALAAVGATGSLINLLMNLFVGFSIGINVLLARYIGAKDYKNAEETIHTSIMLSIIIGIIMIFMGLFFARPLLELMDTPINVIDNSTLYIQVYFLGMPIFMLQNFGSAILRAIGDTKRPFYYLSIGGAISVILNVFFIIVFKMGVVGIALATIISQMISSILIVKYLNCTNGPYRIYKSKLRIHIDKLRDIVKIGLPVGLQSVLFSTSNVIIQKSINSFGGIVIAGNTAASNIEGFVYTAMGSINQTALSFVSQNVGAKKNNRIKKTMVYCLAIVSFIGVVFGQGAYRFGNLLLSIYSSDIDVINAGLIRLSYVSAFYFLCGVTDVMVGSIRGLGYSIMPMMVSILGACAFRIVWVFTVFTSIPTLESLYIVYPLSWALTFIIHFICFIIGFNKFKRKYTNLN